MKLNIALGIFGLAASPLLAQVNTAPSNTVTPSGNSTDAATLKAPYDLPDPVPFANTITPEGIREVLFVLASDSLKGRETGQEGQRKAADFLASCMKKAGIPPAGERGTYFQPILLERSSWKNIGVTVGDAAFKSREDFYVYPAYTNSVSEQKIKEVVFVGYGIDDPKYNDYGKADIAGKAVIMYDGEPMNDKGLSLVTGTEFRSSWSLNWKKKIEVAKAKGAALVFIIDPAIAENLKKNRKMISTYGWNPVDVSAYDKLTKYVNTIFISPAMASSIFGSKADDVAEAVADLKKGSGFKPVKIKNKLVVTLEKETAQLNGSNVIGFIEGSDPELKKEIVVVTAHYDHLGNVDERIYYGADDNASGSSGVVEIARAFAEAKQKGKGPKRSVLCMLVSGEEKGLLGSRYYVDFPLFPLKKTVVDINIDMIGRIDDRHKDGNYVYVIGSDRLSTELHEIQERNNAMYTKMELDYKYNDPNDPNHYYERSDHYNFAERGIPSVFYFNGTHADYHKATDTPDKINLEAAAKRAQLAFYTAWEIANRPYAPIVDKK
jgi:hypothetical protein